MNTLRRLAATFAIVAFAVPLVGTGTVVCNAPDAHDDMSMTAHAGMADPMGADERQCDSCGAGKTDATPPCDHGTAAACASMSLCAASFGALLEVANVGADTRHTPAPSHLEREPSRNRAAPEPPPPRA